MVCFNHGHSQFTAEQRYCMVKANLHTNNIYKQGNSVAQDLPRTGSETNTTICVIYILDIDSQCPYLLSGETTFQLTSCYDSLHVYLQFGETTSPI